MTAAEDRSGAVDQTRVVSVASPAPRDRWRAVHAADPFALVTQSPQWLDVMETSAGWRDASVALRTADGRDLVLPLARRGGSIGIHTSFGEGWGMGGVVAPGGPTPADVAAVLAHLGRQRAVQTVIRPNPLLAAAWQEGSTGCGLATRPKTAHVLDLTGGPDVVYDTRLTTQARRNVRRAERQGVTVASAASPEAIAAFYQMFLKSLARWAERSREPQWMARLRGMRRDPIDKLVSMARVLGDAFRLHVAYVGPEPAAGAIVLLGERNAHYTRGVMDVAVAGRTNAGDYVQWAAIRDAASRGCTTYHMGDTGSLASLAHFKEKFGARPVPYAQYTLERVPLAAADAALRAVVKRAIGFRDA